MLAALSSLLSRMQPIRVARTDEERSAIFRMRYRIYVEEQGDASLPGVDHARREIRTPEDDHPNTTLFYIGSPGRRSSESAARTSSDRLDGTLRVRAWGKGALPPAFRERYSLDRFRDIDERAVCNVSFLMFSPSLRGTASVVGLTSGAIEQTVSKHGSELLVTDCSPGLLRAYGRLGLRPYGARPISAPRGLLVPLVGLTADLDHARRVDSPWLPALRKLAREGKLPARDFRPLLEPLANGGGVTTSRTEIAAALARVAGRRPGSPIARLPHTAQTRLAASAHLIDVAKDVSVLEPGFANRDVFFVLEGSLDVSVDGAHARTIEAGDLFGEVAFFTCDGRRSAQVRTSEPSRILLIRHRALHHLKEKDPRAAAEIYEVLAGTLADRLPTWRAAPPSPTRSPAPS